MAKQDNVKAVSGSTIRSDCKLPDTRRRWKSTTCRRLHSLIVAFQITLLFGFPLNLSLVWNVFGSAIVLFLLRASKLLVCPLYCLILWYIWYQLCCVPGCRWISDMRLEVKAPLQRGRNRRYFMQSHKLLFSQNQCHFSLPGPMGKKTLAKHQHSGSTRLRDLHHWRCSKLDWTSPQAIWWVFKDRPAWNMGLIERSPEVLSNLKVSGNNCDTWVMVITVLIAFMKKAGPPLLTPFNISTTAFLIYASFFPPQ